MTWFHQIWSKHLVVEMSWQISTNKSDNTWVAETEIIQVDDVWKRSLPLSYFFKKWHRQKKTKWIISFLLFVNGTNWEERSLVLKDCLNVIWKETIRSSFATHNDIQLSLILLETQVVVGLCQLANAIGKRVKPSLLTNPVCWKHLRHR